MSAIDANVQWKVPVAPAAAVNLYDNIKGYKLDVATMHDHAEVWEKVVRKLRAGMMPPSGMPRPAAPVVALN